MATDYCFATKYASVKLSELAIGIGPFVVGPAVERKIGIQHFHQWQLTQQNGSMLSGLEKKDYIVMYLIQQEMDKEILTLALPIKFKSTSNERVKRNYVRNWGLGWTFNETSRK